MAKAKGLFSAPCMFGGVAFGDTTARVGVVIFRDTMKLTEADKYFSGSRLTIQLESTGAIHGDGTPSKNVTAEHSGTVDIKSFAANRKRFSFGLTFNLDGMGETEKNSLRKFAKTGGKFIILESERLKEQKAMDFPPDEDEPGDEGKK